MNANELKFGFQLKFDSLFEFGAPAYDDRHISYLLTEAQFRVFIKRYNPLGNKYQKGFEGNEQRRRDLEQLIKSASISGSGTTGNIQYITSFSDGDGDLSFASVIGLNPGLKITGTGLAANTVITGIVGNNIVNISPQTAITKNNASLRSGLGKSSVQGGVHPKGVFLDLPTDYLYAIEEACTLKPNTTGAVARTVESWIKPVRHDEYLANINNPYKKPYKDLVWRMDISRQSQADGSTTASAKRTELIIPDTYTLVEYRTRYLAMPPAIVVDEFDPTNQKHCILDESLHREIVDEAVAIAQAAVKKEEYQIGRAESQQSE